MQTNRQPADRATVAVGLLVLAAGVVLFAAQQLQFELPDNAWPYVIVVPGLALLLVGLVAGRDAGTGLCIAGAIVTTVGLILLYQNATERWESWAYAWALVAPTAPGLGLVLSGVVAGDRRKIGVGTNLVLIGGALFIAGFVFFEGIVGLRGEPSDLLATGVLPAILVVAGVLVVARSLLFPAGRDDGGSTRPSSGTGSPAA